MNRLTEKINLNDDLNEKIRRLEHRLSIFDKPKEKDFNINSYNDGVFLDLMNLNASERNEIILPENENQDNAWVDGVIIQEISEHDDVLYHKYYDFS